MGVPCCNNRGTRISPTEAGDVDDTEVSTTTGGGGGGCETPTSFGRGGGELIVTDNCCCFEGVIKVCSFLFNDPREEDCIRGSNELRGGEGLASITASSSLLISES